MLHVTLCEKKVEHWRTSQQSEQQPVILQSTACDEEYLFTFACTFFSAVLVVLQGSLSKWEGY